MTFMRSCVAFAAALLLSCPFTLSAAHAPTWAVGPAVSCVDQEYSSGYKFYTSSDF